MHVIVDSSLKDIDEIIIRKRPDRWDLTVQVEQGKEALDFPYPDKRECDHVIYCTAGNGMWFPPGQKAWQRLMKNINSLAEEEARKVNVVICGTDEF